MGSLAGQHWGQEFNSVIRSPYVEIKDFLILKNLLDENEKFIALFWVKAVLMKTS